MPENDVPSEDCGEVPQRDVLLQQQRRTSQRRHSHDCDEECGRVLAEHLEALTTPILQQKRHTSTTSLQFQPPNAHKSSPSNRICDGATPIDRPLLVVIIDSPHRPPFVCCSWPPPTVAATQCHLIVAAQNPPTCSLVCSSSQRLLCSLPLLVDGLSSLITASARRLLV
ncbi:hypothetical protein PIB30_084791, partial [Stylosanthes scabra]|nr:hypothetical protein [Stylosanthes scabra]